MSLVIIKPKNHQKVLNLLANILSFITSGRRSIEGISNIVRFDYHLLIIDSLVSIDGYKSEKLSLNIHNELCYTETKFNKPM